MFARFPVVRRYGGDHRLMALIPLGIKGKLSSQQHSVCS
jgi:hypothetical protein